MLVYNIIREYLPCGSPHAPDSKKEDGMRRTLCVASALILLGSFSCGDGGRDEKGSPGDDKEGRPMGGKKLTVFHAGSLSVPMRLIADEFMHLNPGVEIELEAAGSRTSARKISDLGRRCDVMASADFAVIDELLIPEHASWNIRFAGNEMAIAYTSESFLASEIDISNWHELLLEPDVTFGRSDPDSDPCGYRTVMTAKLAERYYGEEGLAERLLAKDNRYMRPKETDLLALLESGAIDYVFIYRSVAVQHGLKMIALPPEINLGDPSLAGLYRTVDVEISGAKPGTTMVRRGAPMVYGLTIPLGAPNPGLAVRFVEFVLTGDRGLRMMEECGQPPLVPSPTTTWGNLPDPLRRFALPPDVTGEGN